MGGENILPAFRVNSVVRASGSLFRHPASSVLTLLMQPAEYLTLHRMEDHHWWFCTLRDMVLGELAERHAGSGPVKLLDAGCGTGGMMQRLRERHPDWSIRGVDSHEAALRCCTRRGLAEVVSRESVMQLSHGDATLDAVLCLDVLYHAQVDEHRALHELHRVLKPGGLLLLNLPAFGVLRGAHDDAVHGIRRYRTCDVEALLRGAGFAPRRLHYWNAWSFPLLLVWRRLSAWWFSESRSPAVSDLRDTSTWLNDLLRVIAQADARLCRHLRPPVGSSVFAVAVKHPRETATPM